MADVQSVGTSSSGQCICSFARPRASAARASGCTCDVRGISIYIYHVHVRVPVLYMWTDRVYGRTRARLYDAQVIRKYVGGTWRPPYKDKACDCTRTYMYTRTRTHEY